MASIVTYAEWVAVLEKFSNGDDTVLTQMEQGSFVLDAGTAQRFYTKVEDAYKTRKKGWLDRFNRSFQFQKMKSENDLEIIFRDAKTNLATLLRFASAAGLPEELRKTLRKDIEDFVLEIKRSLKDDISKTVHNKEKMLLLLNGFGLYEASTGSTTKTGFGQQPNTIPPTGRKIIF
jgi:hypothetical protein